VCGIEYVIVRGYYWFEPKVQGSLGPLAQNWFEQDELKLIPKLAWQDFTASALKGVYQLGGTIRTICN
jgi:hypothetical protein